MKTKLTIVALTLLLAGPVSAQEPLEKSGTEPPTTQNMPPASPSATEPLANPATEPAPQPAPPAPQAATPPTAAPEPLAQAQLRKSEDDNKMVGPLNATVDKVEDMDVFDANGNKIAEVDSVLEDQNGEIKGLAIEYGGFLGIGEKDAILTFDKATQKDGNIVVEMTEDDLAGLPVWHD
ncbi:MAG: PRC-barrel domain-containing protein [Hyphomicrobium sp.]